jgi:hypothetical protein
MLPCSVRLLVMLQSVAHVAPLRNDNSTRNWHHTDADIGTAVVKTGPVGRNKQKRVAPQEYRDGHSAL